MKENEELKRQMLRYVGDFSQLFGIKEYKLVGGRASDVRAFDVKTGAGLEFTLVADRCLDIAGLSFKGVNCSYLNKTGIVSPAYYEKDGVGFLRNFFGGFLTTCGLRNVGVPCDDEGEQFPLHGRISNVPAEEVTVSTEWVDGVPEMVVSGKMREARMFGENLVLTRKITCRYGENKIHIQNTVENQGFRPEGLMLLFHFNLGYPLLDEEAILVTPTAKLTPRDAEAQGGVDAFNRFQAPTANYAEQVFYHELNANASGETTVALVNQNLGIAAALHYRTDQLKNFIQWKQMGEGEYVLGMEPANCLVAGRADERRNGTLEYLQPGESKQFDIVVELVQGTEMINDLISRIESIKAN